MIRRPLSLHHGAAIGLLLTACPPSTAAPPAAPIVRSQPVGLTGPRSIEPRFVRVSGGSGHTCTVTSDGGVVCWGDRLKPAGGGATGTTRRAVRVAGIRDVVALNGAALGTCALRRSGEVMCWGEQGTNARAVPGIRRASSIAAAGFAACALQDGNVLCWDMAPFESGQSTAVPEPRLVRRLTSNAEEICKGEGTLCAREGGQISCWRDESERQPGQIRGVTDATMLDCGDNLACVVHADSTVSCWGGEPTAGDWWLARKVPGAVDIVELAVGDHHACALQASGAVLCWGSNDDGQLGSYRRGSAQAGWVPELPRATAIGAGGRHTCAAQADGSLSCWGANDVGQLGFGEIPGTVTPEKIAGLAEVDALTAAAAYTCATRRGETQCWGVLKSFDAGGTDLELAAPTAIPQFAGITGTVAGPRGQCGWTADATLRCSAGLSSYIRGERPHVAQMLLVDPLASSWWLADDGSVRSLGRGVTVDAARLRPESAGNPRLAAGARVVEIAPVKWLAHTFCARHRDGAVRCIERPEQPKPTISTPTLAPARGDDRPARPLVGVQSLRSNENQVCALLADGTVACADAFADGLTAELVPGLRGVVELAPGESHFCARTRAGEVHCWGANRNGQLGDGTTEGRAAPAPVPGLKDIKAIASGAAHTCALTRSREVMCWGRHYGNGQMSQTIATARSMVPRVVQGHAELGASPPARAPAR